MFEEASTHSPWVLQGGGVRDRSRLVSGLKINLLIQEWFCTERPAEAQESPVRGRD